MIKMKDRWMPDIDQKIKKEGWTLASTSSRGRGYAKRRD